MEPHRRTAWMHGALAALYALFLLLAILLFASRDLQILHPAMLAPFMVFVAVISVHALAGYGASRRKGWARTLSIVTGVLLLLGFPVGTLIGIFLIYNSTRDWGPPKVYGPSLAEGWPAASNKDVA